MAAVQLVGGVHTLTLPVTVIPAGQPCGIKIVLTSDTAGQNVVATGGETSFSSIGIAQNVAPSITVPSGGGSYYTYIAGYMNGVQVAYGAQTNTVVVPGFVIGTGTWS